MVETYKLFPKRIIKRNGDIVIFDEEKITRAIKKCFANCGASVKTEPDYITSKVLNVVSATHKDTTPTVETVQDIVEMVLQSEGEYDAAKHYILYRAAHEKQRIERPVPDSVKRAFKESEQFFKTPIQQFQFYNKYSRYDWDKGRRETWKETIDRAVDYLKELSENKLSGTEYNEIKNAMLNMDAMCSMRLLAMAGTAARRNNISIYNCSFLPVDSLDSFVEALIISMSGCGVGYSVENYHVNKLPNVEFQQDTTWITTHVVQDSAEGWAEAVREGLKHWFAGHDIQFDFSLVRPSGEILKTKGGRASGPGPLKDMLAFAKAKILARQGTKLKSIDAHDIMCSIGNAAVSGGMRRTAMISLFDFEDQDMRDCKSGNFERDNSQRWNANNSAVLPDKDLTQRDVMQLVLDMDSTGRGEPGVFSRRAALSTMPERREAVPYMGTNPCVTGNTKILTDKGYVLIEHTIGDKVNIWNGKEFSSVVPFSTGINEVMQIEFSNGSKLNCTPYHKFVLSDGSRVEAKDLTTESKLMKFEMPIIEEGFVEVKGNPYSQGFYSGDGNEGYKTSWVYETKAQCLDRLIGEKTHQPKYERYFWKHGEMLDKYFVPVNAPLEYKLNWLAGYLDADGSAQHTNNSVSIIAESVNHEFLESVKLMLNTLGVQANVIKGHSACAKSLPNGKGGYSDYQTRETKRLSIGATQVRALQNIGFSTERLDLSNNNPQRDSSRFTHPVVIQREGHFEETFCFTDPLNNTGTFEGIVTANCGEIVLRPMQFCNLSIAIARENDTVEQLMDKVRVATMIGTIQSMATDFKGLRPEWKENCEVERLLGVDITGQRDCKILNHAETPTIMQALKEHAITANRMYAEKLGINQSVSVTCVKPSGNSSQLFDCSAGLHARWSPYYIRNIRVASHSPIYDVMRDMGVPMDPENGQSKETANTWVIHFPVDASHSTMFKDDVSAIEQCEYWRMNKTKWTEHNPSVTITYEPHELIGLCKWIYANQHIIGGMAFLPAFNAKYAQMPFEAIDRDTYLKLSGAFPAIDFSKIYRYEKEDYTTAAQEVACMSGACEISFGSIKTSAQVSA